MYVSRFYNNKKEFIQCNLCPNNCKLFENEIGKCKVYQNINNKLISLNYGKISSSALKNVENIPINHYKPFSSVLKIGSVGCNMSCDFCYNYSITQFIDTHTEYYSPEKLGNLLIENKIDTIAYTYNEPIVSLDYIIDLKKILKDSVNIILDTNLYINKQHLDELINIVDYMVVDYNFIKEDYKKRANADSNVIKNNIKYINNKIPYELSVLLIKDINSDYDGKLLEEIKKTVVYDTPINLKRCFPVYKLEKKLLSEEKLDKIYNDFKMNFNYVYSDFHLKTKCPNCGELLIDREKNENKLLNNKCFVCNYEINGVF